MMSENGIDGLKRELEVAEVDLALLKALGEYGCNDASVTIRRADGTEGVLTQDFVDLLEARVEVLKKLIEKLDQEGDGR